MLLLFVILSFEVPLLIYTIKRSGIVPFPHLALAYIIGCEISISLVTYNFATYKFLRTYSTYSFSTNYFESQIFFFVLFLMSFVLFAPPSKAHFAAKLRRTLQFQITDAALWMLVFSLWAFHLLLALVLNWDLVWENHVYLTMNYYPILSISTSATRFLIAIFPFVGFVVFALLGVHLFGKHRYTFLLLLPLGMFDFLYQLTAHSRKAVMYLVVLAIIPATIRKSKSALLVMIIPIILSLMICLGGRNYGDHGLSSLGETVPIIENYVQKNPAAGFLNIFEGAFATTEMFNRHPSSSLRYEVLSFSPLPSFLDGFDKIRKGEMHRLGRFAPPPAIYEASAFGLPFIILLFLPQIFAGRLAVRLIGRANTALVVTANMLMALSTYLEFTYPIRSVYRYFLLALLLGLLAAFTQSRRARKQTVAATGSSSKGFPAHSRFPKTPPQKAAGQRPTLGLSVSVPPVS
jgi:hypothetical protein